MKFIYLFILFVFFSLAATAEIIPDTIYAITPNSINTENIKKNEKINLYVVETGAFSSGLCLSQGDKIEVEILEYVKPKRGKRDGYYRIEYKGLNNITINGKMRASSPKDMQSIAQRAGITIAGHILKIPGFSQAIAVSKGIVFPNENETRLQSAGKNLYESTPLTYIENGKDFDVEADGIVVIKLKQT